MDDILFCSHRAWAFNQEYDFAKKQPAADKIGRYNLDVRGSPPIVGNSAGYFCIYIIRFDNKKIIIIKREGFDDRVRLRVNSEDRFILYGFFF